MSNYVIYIFLCWIIWIEIVCDDWSLQNKAFQSFQKLPSFLLSFSSMCSRWCFFHAESVYVIYAIVLFSG